MRDEFLVETIENLLQIGRNHPIIHQRQSSLRNTTAIKGSSSPLIIAIPSLRLGTR